MMIANRVEESDLEKWRGVLTDWMAHGWNPRDVNNILDYYTNGPRQYHGRGGKQDRRQVEQSKVSQYDLSKLARLQTGG